MLADRQIEQLAAHLAALRRKGGMACFPAGTPAMLARENAIMIVPVAAPRLAGGITSPTIAMTTDPNTPPVMPAKARASSSTAKLGEAAHARFDKVNKA